MEYSCWSQAFLNEQTDVATCFVTEREWTRLQDEHPDAKRLFAKLTCNGITHHCALGQPVRVEGFNSYEKPIFLPQWILRLLKTDGAGEELTVDWFSEMAFPEATKIVLRPHDSSFFNGNVKEELERVLTRYGILHVGTTIPVPIEQLDGFIIQFDVVSCEPATIVLMQGDEVEILFEKALDDTTPDVVSPVSPDTGDTDAMIPSVEPISYGQPLGGKCMPPLADGRPWNPWRLI